MPSFLFVQVQVLTHITIPLLILKGLITQALNFFRHLLLYAVAERDHYKFIPCPWSTKRMRWEDEKIHHRICTYHAIMPYHISGIRFVLQSCGRLLDKVQSRQTCSRTAGPFVLISCSLVGAEVQQVDSLAELQSKALFSSSNSPQIPLCKKKIPRHIKISANAWSTKCWWN
jgi:hypothetical protein